MTGRSSPQGTRTRIEPRHPSGPSAGAAAAPPPARSPHEAIPDVATLHQVRAYERSADPGDTNPAAPRPQKMQDPRPTQPEGLALFPSEAGGAARPRCITAGGSELMCISTHVLNMQSRRRGGWFMGSSGIAESTLMGRQIEAFPRERSSCSRPGLLLDRDGTIIVDHGYVGSVDRVEFIEGAPEAIARFNRAGVPVAVLTNQAGVAR